jgi:hypothetical protein
MMTISLWIYILYWVARWVRFNASDNEHKASRALWDEGPVGVELYAHDDAVDAGTGGLARACNWAMEGINLAHAPAYADKVKQLAALLRRGWRGALPAPRTL